MNRAESHCHQERDIGDQVGSRFTATDPADRILITCSDMQDPLPYVRQGCVQWIDFDLAAVQGMLVG